MTTNLDSAFDLFFDIKTEEELKRAYLQNKRDIQIMEHLMEREGINYEEWNEYII